MENQNMVVTQSQVDTFLQTNKLDFEVEMRKQFYHANDGSPRFTGYVPVRTDTEVSLSHGGLSEGFVPIQNRDAFSVLTQLSGVKQIELKNGGIWGNGAGVFAQISLGNMIVGKDYGDIGRPGQRTDQVEKFLSVVNTHDGSRALIILITPRRYFCMNQIAYSVNEAQAKKNHFISVRHNSSSEEKLQELIRTVKIADEVFQTTEETYNKMLSLKINEEYVKETLRVLFPLNPEAGKRGKTIWENQCKAVSDRLYSADQGRGDVWTAWNLYNSIQGTFQHDSRNTETKNRSILMGDIADKSASALATVLEICSSEHIPASVKNEIDFITA